MEDVKNNPDDYQWERALCFNVTQPSIKKTLKRLNVSYKTAPKIAQSDSVVR